MSDMKVAKTEVTEVTKGQLSQLDELLSSFNGLDKSKKTKINGDDVAMLGCVSAASACSNSDDDSFLNSIVHIKSSYSGTVRSS